MRFKVSLAQINPKSGDLDGNVRKILAGITRARREACDLVVFPEMCLTGYCLDEKLLINRSFLRANKQKLLEEVAPATHGIAAIVGFLDFDESSLGPDRNIRRHNAAAVLQDGRLLQTVHKRLLPAYRYFDDPRYFCPGREAEPVKIRVRDGDISVGVLICEDLWDTRYDFQPGALYQAKGVEYLFTINASPFVASRPDRRTSKRFERAELIAQHIERYGLPVVYVNTVGVGDNGKNIIPFDGMSVAFDRAGRLVASLQQFSEDQQSVCFEDGYAPPVPEAPFDREAEIYQALVMAVRDYYEKVGIFRGVLEAVSGGIDSALGTAIAFEAMGRELLTLYNLPSRHSSEMTQRLARRLAENFGLEYHVIPIQGIVDRIVEDFEKHLHPISRPVTIENLQSRIRGLIMMAESNDREALLLTNGNETEIALGYATLYGDMVGGLSLIGDLPKPEIYQLARYVNRRWEREMIPEGIFEIAPSAELKESQVDPFDYPVVGPVINEFIETGASPRELARRFEERTLGAEKYQLDGQSVYEKYTSAAFQQLAEGLYRQLSRSVYKRLQGAPIIVVSERAFGFDLRETIINGWGG